MYGIYMVTFTIHIPPMLAYMPYMDPMGNNVTYYHTSLLLVDIHDGWLAPTGCLARLPASRTTRPKPRPKPRLPRRTGRTGNRRALEEKCLVMVMSGDDEHDNIVRTLL